MCNEIGVRIGRLREKKGITQAELAAALGVKRETVAQWETGTRDIKTDNTVKLADYFGVTCDYLLRGIKAENVDIHRKLGLSDAAVEMLIGYQEEIERLSLELPEIYGKNYVWHIDIINRMLEQGWHNAAFIEHLTEAVNAMILYKKKVKEMNEANEASVEIFKKFRTELEPKGMPLDQIREAVEDSPEYQKYRATEAIAAQSEIILKKESGYLAWEAQVAFHDLIDDLVKTLAKTPLGD